MARWRYGPGRPIGPTFGGVPLTFPTHPVAVLPLKLWRPRWFDGVALLLGSMAPDLAYALDGSGLPVWPFSHQYAGLFGWCLPITLVGAWMVRRVAPVLSAHVPVGDIRPVGPRWWVTVSSALVGAASHLVLDRIEAPPVEYVLHVAGVAGLVWYVRRRPRRRTGPRRPLLFWSVVALVTLPAVAVIPFLPAAFLAHTTGVRLLCAVGAGLLVASMVVAAFGPYRSARKAVG